MKKLCIIMLCALLLWPTAGLAQGLPDFLSAVEDGLTEGLALGVTQAADQELTLALTLSAPRVEEGQTITLRIQAGNPRVQETSVHIELKLPERLKTEQDTSWDALLPAAQIEDGTIVPSQTVFTRDVTLVADGGSEQASLYVEMSMGTRFYRAETTLDLCVPDISASASVDGLTNGRAQMGDVLTYRIDVTNAGTADKDVEVELLLPDGMALTEPLPAGFVCEENRLVGQVWAAAQGSVQISLPVCISDTVLDGDEDAMRLMTGSLRVDGMRVPLPRVQVCGPKISARLLTDADSLAAGDEMTLRVVVVNAGLADADVHLTCALPEGLTLVQAIECEENVAQADGAAQDATRDEAAEERNTDGDANDEENDDANDTENMNNDVNNDVKDDVNEDTDEDKEDTDEAKTAQAALPPEDHGPLAGEAEPVQDAPQAELVMRQENNTLLYDLHMDAASETSGSVTASTRVLTWTVRAEETMDDVKERLLGATLAWQVDEGETQLGEAVAVRVYQPLFLGISSEEWNGIFWASLLLVITVVCLYAALRSDEPKEAFSCE